MVEEKWNELKEAQVFTNALKLVRLQKETYKNYYEKNYIRWSKRIEKGNGEVIKEINSYKTQGEAADYLYNWLDKRIKFLDSVWGK